MPGEPVAGNASFIVHLPEPQRLTITEMGGCDMSKLGRQAAWLAAAHRWRVAMMWMRDANHERGLRDKAVLQLERYFEAVEEIVERLQLEIGKQ